METASSIITDILCFLGRRDLPPGVHGSIGRLNISTYGPSILLCQINLGSFLKVSARSVLLAIFVLVAMSSIVVIHTLGSLATSINLFGCFPHHTGVSILADGD
jgi:hypothetical protein